MPTQITLEKNWIIFDTCTISKMLSLDDPSILVRPILEKVGNFTPVITPLVRCEFLRSANDKNEFEKFRNYLLSNYVEIDLSQDEDKFSIFNLASELGCIYRFINKDHNKHIELVDIIHAGLMRRYPKNLYLLTFDIKDFPQPIFEIFLHQSIKVNKNLEICALFKFNKNEFSIQYNKNFKK